MRTSAATQAAFSPETDAVPAEQAASGGHNVTAGDAVFAMPLSTQGESHTKNFARTMDFCPAVFQTAGSDSSFFTAKTNGRVAARNRFATRPENMPGRRRTSRAVPHTYLTSRTRCLTRPAK